MFGIEVGYYTGNSLGSHNQVETPKELIFSNESTAIINMNRIYNHYKAYQECCGYNKGKNVKPQDFKNEDWYCDSYVDDYYLGSSIKLIDDENNTFTFSVDWVGYFEGLNYLKIVYIGEEIVIN